MTTDGQARPTGPAGSRIRAVAWPVRSGLVPPLAEGFIVRPETAPGLEAALAPGSVVALVPSQGAAGGARDWPGSCGKTQLASCAAGSLWRSRAVDLLAWVPAMSRASVLSGYVQAAARLGLDHARDAESVAARLLAWLGGAARPWLVVLDDLCRAEDLEGLWPAGPAGRLLITTADPGTIPAERRTVVAAAVPAFSTREALTYLSDRLTTDPHQRSGAIDLAAALGCEPAALAHAGAVIASSGMPCRDYRQYFLHRQAQLLAAAGEEPAPAAGTWTLSADHAEQLSPDGGTWLLLVLTALLDARGIPGTVFTAPATSRYLAGEDAARPPDPQRAWSALLALERAGLLAVDPASTPPTARMSPAMQTAIRAVTPQGILDRAARAAADALLDAWPADQPGLWPAAALRSCAASLRRVAGDALWAGGGCHRLLLLAGQSLDDARLTGPAVAWWRELATDSDRILGPGHPDTVTAGGLLAAALLAAGQAAESASWSEWVLVGCASMLGPDHRGTITARVSLGRALVAAGRPGDAVAVLDEAADCSERVYGPDDLATVTAREEHAAACLAAGKAAEAIRSCRRSLADRERLQGPAHPDALATGLRLAGAYLDAGKVKDAIGQYKRVLTGRERMLGADHPDTLLARAALAAAYGTAGQMGTALQLHEETCAEYERVLGADHPDTLACHADLARAYYRAGQVGDAVTLLRDTITRSEQALSSGDPLTQALRETLAGITGEMTAP
jgi:tetratricopeptide (TPR) repeat protein